MGEMPARLHVNYEAGDGQDVEVYVDGKYVLGVTHDEIGSKGVAAVAGAARHVAAALAPERTRAEIDADIDRAARSAPRPKLEIVEGGVGTAELYIDGRYVADTDDTALEVAKRLARALGADVDEVADPAPHPYTYFIAYQGEKGHVGNAWWTSPAPIENPDVVRKLTEQIKADKPELGGVVITNFIFIDGPC